jgi:hypothetical protein
VFSCDEGESGLVVPEHYSEGCCGHGNGCFVVLCGPGCGCGVYGGVISCGGIRLIL